MTSETLGASAVHSGQRHGPDRQQCKQRHRKNFWIERISILSPIRLRVVVPPKMSFVGLFVT